MAGISGLQRQPQTLRLAEIVSALSYALDLTDGQPAGHSVRCCWIGMHLGERLGLSDAEKHDLYYTLLLKDLGCSSNAARICKLFATSDHDFKRNAKLIDNSFTQVLGFIAANTAVRSGLAVKLRTVLSLAMSGGKIDRELIETRCERGAEIARRMRFSEPVAKAILDLDEHWDGRGQPLGRKGAEISPLARIALLAQVVDVFYITSGRKAACREVRRRAGKWFDPHLASVFEDIAADPDLWSALQDPQLDSRVFALEPAGFSQAVDEDLLDDIADGFAQVIDAKSPFTSGHSKRVALFADLIATELGFSRARKRWLVRGALLHDIGKLGVSNEVLDKPAKLDPQEWAAMKSHPDLGAGILERIDAFRRLATIARNHHEKLDGSGYPQGLSGGELDLETRIVTVADIFDALTADRPYRAAMPASKALAIMAADVGVGLDPACYDALTRALQGLEAKAA
ncbi:HD-GYP domain-containing protein [Ensifer sp. HO-A22]|uniref:HD-GYP domain-containing protein n=1 Tax=Ensifer oleiphilus TaxID=2742698 RepID=A0A7Y6UMN1_9HYPH|nr:HD-GYP domain-containing protein [Ensifer oleiphilus]NVD39119.1 HD-GYP domain-containing protein [Ensifer oleiphilus]